MLCLCKKGGLGPCPFCSLADLLEAGKKAGLGPKHPLFPTRKGKAATAKAVIRALRLLMRRRLTEHSMRREGAQILARRYVPVPLIQFLGRWGPHGG